jgi:hypothetical protein
LREGNLVVAPDQCARTPWEEKRGQLIPYDRMSLHVGIEIRKTAGWEICHLAFVKVISPMPTLNVPKMTVTFSLRGCQWGAIQYPSGIFKRTV